MSNTQEIEHKIREARRAALIINTCSRRGERLGFQTRDMLESQGIAVTTCRAVRHPERLRTITLDALERGHELVIVAGGDGTISSVVGLFIDRDAVLGLLPLGTGNSFARTLGIPLTAEGAVEVIVHGKVADVDLGKVDGLYFANFADIGLSAETARATPRLLKRFAGALSYPLVAIGMLFRHRAFTCRLIHDGREETYRTHEVVIANGRIYGELPLPEATIENQALMVYVVDLMNRRQLTRLWLDFLRGKPSIFEHTHAITTREVWIETDPDQCVNVDGELLTRTPVHVSVAPQALNVLVPQSYKE